MATFKHFIFALLPWTAEREEGITTSNEGLKGVLTLLDSDEEGLWGVRAKWGWYREFVRRVRWLSPPKRKPSLISHSLFSIKHSSCPFPTLLTPLSSLRCPSQKMKVLQKPERRRWSSPFGRSFTCKTRLIRVRSHDKLYLLFLYTRNAMFINNGRMNDFHACKKKLQIPERCEKGPGIPNWSFTVVLIEHSLA